MENEKIKFEIVSIDPSYLPTLREIFLHGRRAIDPIASTVMNLEDFDKETLGEQILVATKDGYPIGFISIWLADNFIHHLYVEESNQGIGVGDKLLKNALRILSGTVELKCFVSNLKAFAFYRKHGFQIKETVESELGDYHVLTLSLMP